MVIIFIPVTFSPNLLSYKSIMNLSFSFSPQFPWFIPTAGPRQLRDLVQWAQNERSEKYLYSPKANIGTVFHLRRIESLPPANDLILSSDHIILSPKSYIPLLVIFPELTSHIFHLRFITVEDSSHTVLWSDLPRDVLDGSAGLGIGIPLGQVGKLREILPDCVQVLLYLHRETQLHHTLEQKIIRSNYMLRIYIVNMSTIRFLIETAEWRGMRVRTQDMRVKVMVFHNK